jgi:DNA-binding GntR family transcriptional regulator
VPSLADEVYRGIKRRIVRLEMSPGSRFTEAELASRLGVSKTPVREALSRLNREGLVEVDARLGYRVTPVTVQDTKDLFALRTLLEAECAAAAALRGEGAAALRDLEKLCQASYHPADAASIDEFLRANTHLHLSIAELAGNARVVRVLREILDQSERLFHIGLALSFRSNEIVHEHSDLVGAIIAGDGARAKEISISQSRSSEKMVIDAMLLSPAVLSTNVIVLPREQEAV